MVKNPPANEGDLGLIPWSERQPGEANGNPLQYFCLKNPHGQRSLECYSSWCHKVSHNLVTEQQLEFVLYV